MKKTFLTTAGGAPAHLYTIAGAGGLRAEISDFGGVLYRLLVPGRDGKARDVVLGFADPADYRKAGGPYFGALIGRVANRIGGASFLLDGVRYQLPQNDGRNSLHGGSGFSHRLWSVTEHTADTLALRLFSPDGDAGYPGELTVDAIYRITADNALELEFRAMTDSVTVVNLTNHSYFNLDGEAAGSLAGQELMIHADFRQEADAALIPTGRLLPVAETAYDLRKFRSFDELFARRPQGFDDNYIGMDAAAPAAMRPIAAARSRRSGIQLNLSGTAPAVQLYTAGFLNGVAGKHAVYAPSGAFCLETQGYIDAPNHPDFPSIRLEAGEAYYQKVRYEFRICAP